MTLSRSDWKAYVDRLALINRRAGALMQQYLDLNGYEDTQQLLGYAYALVTKYGGASSALACEMYDALALAQGVTLPAAEPAETADFGEVAKAVRGTMKNERNSVPDTVSRLVKQAGADTSVQNAIRDGAEWAWIPSGDTCAFCLTLASRGWQKASKKTLRGDHAEHIHAHCNCEFAIRFDGKSTVAGYDPEAYREAYYNAEGSTPKEKINALRRDWYAGNKDKINQQKRMSYKRRVEKSGENGKIGEEERSRNKPGNDDLAIVSEIVGQEAFAEKMRRVGEDDSITNILTHQARTTLWRRNGTPFEDLVFIDSTTGKTLVQRSQDIKGGVGATEKMKEMVASSPRRIIALHNHPHSMLPSRADLISAKHYKYGVIVCHNGSIIKYQVSEYADIDTADAILDFMQPDFTSGKISEGQLEQLARFGVSMEVHI